MTAALVVIGGGSVAQAIPRDWRDRRLVIAADSGVDLAHRLGLEPTVVVGDLDSASAPGLHRARAAGATVERMPVDKDQTDFELALSAARSAGSSTVGVLGGAWGRLDHLVANLAVLTGPLTDGLEVEAWVGTSRVQVLRGSARVEGWPGMTVSLSAWHGSVTGISSRGLRWELCDAELEAGSARGTSNELTADIAEVSLAAGCLSVIAPDAWRLESVEVIPVPGVAEEAR